MKKCIYVTMHIYIIDYIPISTASTITDYREGNTITLCTDTSYMAVEALTFPNQYLRLASRHKYIYFLNSAPIDAFHSALEDSQYNGMQFSNAKTKNKSHSTVTRITTPSFSLISSSTVNQSSHDPTREATRSPIPTPIAKAFPDHGTHSHQRRHMAEVTKQQHNHKRVQCTCSKRLNPIAPVMSEPARLLTAE